MPSKLTLYAGVDATGVGNGLRTIEGMVAGSGNRVGRSLSLAGGGRGGVLGEFLVVIRELGRGNYSRIPGSITILSQRLGLLKYVINESGEAAGASLTPFGRVLGIFGLLAVGAYLLWRHLKTVTEEFTRTGEEAEKGYGNMEKAIESAMEKSAEATANLVEWNKRLSSSQETIAETTNAVISALSEEYALKKQLAELQGKDKKTIDAMEQEERQLKIDAANKGIEAANAAEIEDRKKADHATDEAYRNQAAIDRQAKIHDLPAQRSDAEKKLEEAKKFQKELQQKTEDFRENLLNTTHSGSYGSYTMTDAQREQLRQRDIARQTALFSASPQSVGEKGHESRHSLDEINQTVSENEKLVQSMKTDLPRLMEVQRELESAQKDALEAGKKDSESVQSLTKERDKLLQEFKLHSKYDPLIEGADATIKENKVAHQIYSDSGTRVGNFIGGSRGQIGGGMGELIRLQRQANRHLEGIERNTSQHNNGSHTMFQGK